MAPMLKIVNVSYDPEVDAAAIDFTASHASVRTVHVDDARHFDEDADGQVTCIELLDVSKGVRLDGLPEPELVRQALQDIADRQGWATAPIR